MINEENIYCLDANVLIQAWQKYYSPKICPDYWVKLNELGKAGVIFLPAMVYEEITRTEDELSDWLKKSDISKEAINEDVTKKLKLIYGSNPKHKLLADNTKGRSLADPWLIAHAISRGAIVVTKEEMVTRADSKKIKIPNVCQNMGIQCINDFEFITRVNFKFSCTIG